MSRTIAFLAALGTIAVLAFAAPVSASAKQAGVSNAEQMNVSAARRHVRRYHRRWVRPYRPYYGHYPYYSRPYYYYRPYYRPYYYGPLPFFPFAPWW